MKQKQTNFVDFQNLMKIESSLRQIFEILIIYEPFGNKNSEKPVFFPKIKMNARQLCSVKALPRGENFVCEEIVRRGRVKGLSGWI